jgi:hypothetical protein
MTGESGEDTHRGEEAACPRIGVDALVIRRRHLDGFYSKISE